MIRFLPLLLAIAALWAQWPWLWQRTWDRSGDPSGMLALGGAMVLFMVRGRKGAGFTPSPLLLAAAAAAMATHALMLGRAPHLVAVGPAALAVALSALAALPAPARRESAALPLLLLLALPIQPSLQFVLGYPLRRAASQGAVLFLRAGGIAAEARGVGIQVGDREIFVDPACSGAHMLWSALCVSALLAAWRGTGPLGLALQQVIAVALAVGANAWRSAAVALMEVRIAPLAPWAHEGIGLLAFGIVVLALAAAGPRREASRCAA